MSEIVVSEASGIQGKEKEEMMVIDTKYSGEDIRELINSSLIVRFGYDGESAYLHLKDGSIVIISGNRGDSRNENGNESRNGYGNGYGTSNLAFTHRIITKIK